MKHYIQICIVTFSFLGVGAGEELPRDLQELISRRSEAVARIDRIFVGELEKLKINYTKKGDLDSANTIVTLIEKYRIDDDQELETSKPLSEVFGKTYSWTADGRDDGNRLSIMKDGKGTMRGVKITWEKLGEREIRITFPNGEEAAIKWTANFKNYTGRETRRNHKLAGKLVE
ncbi:hypothetical protein V2O64_16025 [Verrucomicrobiaceae bacterium 227]